MRFPAKALALTALATALAAPAKADLIGTVVDGSLTFGGNTINAFDPANGFVYPGYGNSESTSVTISDDIVEFQSAASLNGYLVDFTGDTLTYSFSPFFFAPAPYTMTFTNAAFVGLILTEISDTFPNGGITASLDGDTITLTYAGMNLIAASASYSIQGVSVPEPSSLVLAGFGVVGLLASRRKGGRRTVLVPRSWAGPSAV